jgi:hypothetical protein
MRTNDLKKLIQTKLKTITTDVYYEVASDDALYPHIVFDFDSINLGDLSRQDYMLNIDVWSKGKNTKPIDDMCDSIEELLQGQNLPQENILPTFYLVDRRTVPDQDKDIKHRLIRFQVQNYVR